MMSFLEEAFRIDRRFFEKNQRFLLKLANTRLGRVFYGIKDHPFSRKFVRILPNAVEWDAGNGKRTIQFIPCDYYADQVRRVLKTVGAFSLGAGLQLIEGRAFALLPMLAGTTTTFNSSSSAVSGYTRRTASGETFSTIRDSAGNGAGSGSVALVPRWEGNSTDDLFNRMDRGHVMFDTSALAGATGVSADLSLYHTSKDTPTETSVTLRAVHVCASTAADPTALASTDYVNVGSTSFANIAFASFTGSAYNTFTLDSNGIANINLSGISKFALRSGADITNTAPSTAGSGDSYAVRFQTEADANKPRLVVTYTPAPTTTTITKSLQYCIKTTPSTITKSLQYVVTSTVTNTITKSLQYAIKTSPTITKSLQYCIKRTPSTITKAVQYAVNVPKTITKSLQYVINFIPEALGVIRGTVNSTGIIDGTQADVPVGTSEMTNIVPGTINNPPEGKKTSTNIATGAKL